MPVRMRGLLDPPVFLLYILELAFGETKYCFTTFSIKLQWEPLLTSQTTLQFASSALFHKACYNSVVDCSL